MEPVITVGCDHCPFSPTRLHAAQGYFPRIPIYHLSLARPPQRQAWLFSGLRALWPPSLRPKRPFLPENSPEESSVPPKPVCVCVCECVRMCETQQASLTDFRLTSALLSSKLDFSPASVLTRLLPFHPPSQGYPEAPRQEHGGAARAGVSSGLGGRVSSPAAPKSIQFFWGLLAREATPELTVMRG